MITLKVNTTGGAALAQRFGGAQNAIREQVLGTLEHIGGNLEALMRSKASALIAGRSKGRHSGKLGRSFYHRVAAARAGNVLVLTTGVSRRAFYAAFQDKGVPRKSVDVRSYTTGARRSRGRKGKGIGPAGTGMVRAYTREMFLRPEPFIGVSLHQMTPEILADLHLAVMAALRGP